MTLNYLDFVFHHKGHYVFTRDTRKLVNFMVFFVLSFVNLVIKNGGNIAIHVSFIENYS